MTATPAIAPYLMLLIHGESKTGKTSLLATAPKPLLVLDSEAGGMRFIDERIIQWDPSLESIPEGAGTDWDVCRVRVRRASDLDAAYRAVSQAEHPFKSIGIDSITEFQARLKRDIDPDGKIDMQGWGTMLAKMEDVVWGFQDMVEHPRWPIKVFAVIAGTRMRDAKYRPYLQGQTVTQMPYKVDICGFLTTTTDEEQNTRRALMIRGSDIHDIGERVHGINGLTPAGNHLNDIVWDPNIKTIFEQIHGEEA